MFGTHDGKKFGLVALLVHVCRTYAIFMPMHYLGMAGHPRRYSQGTELAFLHPFSRFRSHHLRRFYHHRSAIYLSLQSLLEHEIRKKAATTRGKRPRSSGRRDTSSHDNFADERPAAQRPVRVRVPGRSARLRDADGSGNQ